MTKRLGAEFLGTAWLVFGGCGSAVLAAAFPGLGIGFVGVALAFGLTVLTMAYAVGHISGGHFNPAVTVGPVPRADASRRARSCPTGRAGAGRASRARSCSRSSPPARPASTSPERLRRERLRRALAGRLLARRGLRGRGGADVLLPDRILGSTDRRAPAGFAPIAIGLGAHPHPPRRHPGHQHVGEPGAQHRPGPLRRRLGARAAVALLGRADRRRRRGRRRQPLAGRGRRQVATRPAEQEAKPDAGSGIRAA